MKNYASIYKTVHIHPNSFFIGANTACGFSYADKTVPAEASLAKLYILKGGPGTGKSSLMKKCREHFEKTVTSVTSYYCSSDPDSLDAVIIEHNGKKIAITDGTSPHSIDGNLPGAISEIINLGEFWNSTLLESQREQIAKLASSKKIAFTTASKYIKAATEANAIINETAEKGLMKEKAKKSIRRIVATLPKQKAEQMLTSVFTEAISMKGAFRLDTFESAKHLYAIEDFCRTAPIFLQILTDALVKKGFSVTVARSPLSDICEIYLPDSDTAFVPFRDGVNYEKIIRMTRFADKNYFSENMAKRRFNEKYLYRMCEAALSSLNEAQKYHFALEEIYIKAMQFKGVDKLRDKLISDIASYLQ